MLTCLQKQLSSDMFPISLPAIGGIESHNGFMISFVCVLPARICRAALPVTYQHKYY